MRPASAPENALIAFGWVADATQKSQVSLVMPKSMGRENATDLFPKAASAFAGMALTAATEMANNNHGWF